jgi:hypothetical protein
LSGRVLGERFAAARAGMTRPLLLAILLALPAFLATACSPCRAFSFLTEREVSVHFATAQGVPMANAAVRVFAPGNVKVPVATGRTDSEGNFTFSADKNGFWSAEAASGGDIARVMIRMGAGEPERGPLPRLLLGGVIVLLVIALAYRILRRRRRP